MIRFIGNSKPEFEIAARTRWPASRTARSGRPTIASAGSPLRTSTSTVTARAVTPESANVLTVASIGATLRPPM